MIQNQRIIWNDNGTEKDLSVNLNSFRAGSETIAIVADEDKIYIGSDLPFNHRWVDVSTANDEVSVISAEIWYSRQWIAAVDLIDRTSVGGATLAQSGVVQWRTNREKGWDRELDSEDVDGVSVSGLYDMYWLRFSFSSDLKVTTALSHIGHRFSSDADLVALYPDLNNSALKTAFATGKTTWNEQHFMAADAIISDLRRANIIKSPSQILDYELFQVPAVHKCAEIIYYGMGRAYDENRLRAQRYYNESFQMSFFNMDVDKNANLSDVERRYQTGFVTR